MISLKNIWPWRAHPKTSRKADLQGLPASSTSLGGTREGRKELLVQQVGRVVSRSPEHLCLCKVRCLSTDASGFEFLVIIDLEAMPSQEVTHETAAAITRRARERFGLNVKAVYWRGLGATQPKTEKVEHQPQRPNQEKRSRAAHADADRFRNDFAASSPADLHLQELGLAKPAC